MPTPQEKVGRNYPIFFKTHSTLVVRMSCRMMARVSLGRDGEWWMVRDGFFRLLREQLQMILYNEWCETRAGFKITSAYSFKFVSLLLLECPLVSFANQLEILKMDWDDFLVQIPSERPQISPYKSSPAQHWKWPRMNEKKTLAVAIANGPYKISCVSTVVICQISLEWFHCLISCRFDSIEPTIRKAIWFCKIR